MTIRGTSDGVRRSDWGRDELDWDLSVVVSGCLLRRWAGRNGCRCGDRSWRGKWNAVVAVVPRRARRRNCLRGSPAWRVVVPVLVRRTPEVPPELLHALARVDAERAPLVRVELLRRRAAPRLEVGPTKGGNAGERKVRESRKVLQELVDRDDGQVVAVRQVDPLER